MDNLNYPAGADNSCAPWNINESLCRYCDSREVDYEMDKLKEKLWSKYEDQELSDEEYTEADLQIQKEVDDAREQYGLCSDCGKMNFED